MGEFTLRFDPATQSLDALNASAYRMIGIAICQTKLVDGDYVVTLTTQDHKADDEDVRRRFLATVIDENLRAQIAKRTEPVRNLILALAFGAMAEKPS